MLTKEDFDTLLHSRRNLVIDGALATELEVRGHDLNHPLWSAKILRDDSKSIEAVHLDYFLAGADIAITSSYQASTRGLTDHFSLNEEEGKALIRRSVEVAQHARDAAYREGVSVDRTLLIAGSVGPFGAYLADGSEYRGDYVVSPEEFKHFHRPRIQALIDGGVDLLALETIPCLIEVQAIIDLLREEFPAAIAWLSCTVHDSKSLCDKTPWEDVIRAVGNDNSQIIAIGINCVPLAVATDTLKCLSALTTLPLVCYPNSGETWDAVTKTWHGERPDTSLEEQSADEISPGIATNCHDWTLHGARLIGGCCRTGPAFIQAVDRALQRQQHQ